jgi:LysM repeat protein
MLTKHRIVVLLLTLALLAAGLPFSTALAANTTVTLTPGYQNIAIGASTTINFNVVNVTNLYAYSVAIGFDPTVLEVLDADAGKPGVQVALGSWLQPNYVVSNTADNAAGTIIVGLTQFAPTPPVSGSGTLFTINFRGKAQGLSNVNFTEVRLANSDGMEIATTRQNAQITVGTVTQPTATFTPTSTPTAPTPTWTPTPGVWPTWTPTPGVWPTWTPTPGVWPTWTPTPAPPGQTVIYVVRSGDTMYSISRRFGVSVACLSQANNISNPNRIYAGQRLVIPRDGCGTAPYPTPPPGPTPIPPTPCPPQPGQSVYVVQRGDTMYSIARRFGCSVYEISVANNIANPSLIYAGQRLIIPSTCSCTPSPPTSGRVHVVQRGETLYSIARRYGTTVWAIAMANNLSNPNVIYAGQRLVIP